MFSSNNGLYAQAPEYAGGGMVPASNYGGASQGGMDWNALAGHAQTAISGMQGNSGKPYGDAADQYREWAQKGEAAQRPYQEAGAGAIPAFQQWLSGQKDPSGFINNLMNQYQQSPWAKYQQEQSARRYGNAGSASGLTGSTPLEQFEMQNAHDISQGDMKDWLSNVLGINNNYGEGQQSLIQGGQNAANSLTSMYGDMGRQMGEAAFGQRAGKNQDSSNLWGGLLGTAGTVVGSIYGGPVGGAAGGAIGSKVGNYFGS